jgi:hypothetical protein
MIGVGLPMPINTACVALNIHRESFEMRTETLGDV